MPRNQRRRRLELGHVEDLVRSIRCERLIGIGLQYRKDLRVLFGVRISLVVAALAKYCPETARLLPEPSFRLNVVSDEDATGAT